MSFIIPVVSSPIQPILNIIFTYCVPSRFFRHLQDKVYSLIFICNSKFMQIFDVFISKQNSWISLKPSLNCFFFSDMLFNFSFNVCLLLVISLKDASELKNILFYLFYFIYRKFQTLINYAIVRGGGTRVNKYFF